MKGINIIAVVVVAILQMALSAGWYGAFAQPWIDGHGLTMADAENGESYQYIIAFIGYLALNVGFSVLLRKMDITSIGHALIFAFILWFGFFFCQEATHYLFAFKSWSLVLIDTGNTLVCYLLAGAILSKWR